VMLWLLSSQVLSVQSCSRFEPDKSQICLDTKTICWFFYCPGRYQILGNPVLESLIQNDFQTAFLLLLFGCEKRK
jgi:hypothetical protein